MNYVILNGHDFFNGKIDIESFHEVNIDGEDRVDVVFGEFSIGLLESSYEGRGDGVEVFPEQWLLSDRGVKILCFRIPQDILYQGRTELIKELFGFFCEDSHYIEIRGFSCKAFGLEKDVYDYYLIATHKSLDTPLLINESVGLINSDKSGEKYKNSLSFVLKKIKERLL